MRVILLCFLLTGCATDNNAYQWWCIGACGKSEFTSNANYNPSRPWEDEPQNLEEYQKQKEGMK